MTFEELFAKEFGEKYLEGFFNRDIRLDAEEVMRIVRSAQEDMRERAASLIEDNGRLMTSQHAATIRALPIEV